MVPAPPRALFTEANIPRWSSSRFLSAPRGSRHASHDLLHSGFSSPKNWDIKPCLHLQQKAMSHYCWLVKTSCICSCYYVYNVFLDENAVTRMLKCELTHTFKGIHELSITQHNQLLKSDSNHNVIIFDDFSVLNSFKKGSIAYLTSSQYDMMVSKFFMVAFSWSFRASLSFCNNTNTGTN